MSAEAASRTAPDGALVTRLAAHLRAEVIETHISWILLAGPFAYKVKKPVHLPFVDYSTLEKRRHFCEQEVRLNGRLAPSLYLGVSRITGPADQPALDGAGPLLEYAVRMRRFAAGALFSEQLAQGRLGEPAVDAFAALLAKHHEDAPVAWPRPVAESAHRVERAHAALAGAAAALDVEDFRFLERWIAAQGETLAALWEQRRSLGKVRECHGDLHLGNVVGLEEGVAAFDCIEFDPALRWIDILEDAAFPLMDFCARGRPDLGWRFFNAWLEATGEYDGLQALAFSVVERALVRAQVDLMRSPRGGDAAGYVRTALEWARGRQPTLAITTGLPGSGKSYASQRHAQREGAVRLRSDVERKRLFGLAPLDDSHARGLDLYTPEATRRTYGRLFTLARAILRAGLPVVLDAAFLRREERAQAAALAKALDVPFAILVCEAPLPVLRQRLAARQGDASEASVAVLDRLRLVAEPLGAEEASFRVVPAD